MFSWSDHHYHSCCNVVEVTSLLSYLATQLFRSLLFSCLHLLSYCYVNWIAFGFVVLHALSTMYTRLILPNRCDSTDLLWYYWVIVISLIYCIIYCNGIDFFTFHLMSGRISIEMLNLEWIFLCGDISPIALIDLASYVVLTRIS